MRLTLVIHSLGCGGAERVMSILANYWSSGNCDVTLLTFDDGATPAFYDLAPNVDNKALGLANESQNILSGIKNNISRIRVLRRAIRNSRPDVVISFMNITNVITLIATRGLDIPVFVAEHTDPAMSPSAPVWRWLRLRTYSRATAVVVLSEGAMDYFTPSLRAPIRVIPNPVVRTTERTKQPEQELKQPFIAAMGRLVRLKGFDILLAAFAQLKDKHPEWMLNVIGDGPLQTELELLRDSLGLKDRVRFLGIVKNPSTVLDQSELFVMSSHYEGFPMSLCEAMASGVASISTDCSSGVRAIVRNGIDGLLVPKDDIEALAVAMDRLMSDDCERMRFGSRAAEVTQRFSIQRVMAEWNDLLGRPVQKQSRCEVTESSFNSHVA